MNRMTRFLMAILAFALIMSSCNKGPGEGGTGTVQGYVKLVHHPDDDFTLTPDTMVAAKTDVFIIYGDEACFGNDVETGADGMYQFEYLLPGDYTVFAYSNLPSGEKVAVSETVHLTRGAVAQAPTLYIHDGKRTGVDGKFAFQKLQPGEYELFTVTENGDEFPMLLFQSVTVEEGGQIYELEEPFVIRINL